MKGLTTIYKRTAKHSPLWAIIGGLLIDKAIAQTPVPSDGSEGAPLDGFTPLLLVAAIGYGIQRMRKAAKPKEEFKK